jgi:hypothetical protein
MPPQDCVRLNDARQTEQPWPQPSHDRSHEALNGAVHPSGQYWLMPKKEILDFKPAPRPAQVGDKRPKQIEHGKHRAG